MQYLNVKLQMLIFVTVPSPCTLLGPGHWLCAAARGVACGGGQDLRQQATSLGAAPTAARPCCRPVRCSSLRTAVCSNMGALGVPISSCLLLFTSFNNPEQDNFQCSTASNPWTC